MKFSFLDGIERSSHSSSALSLLYALNSIETGDKVPIDAWQTHITDPRMAIVRMSFRITLVEAAFTSKQIYDWCTAPTVGAKILSYFDQIEYALRCGFEEVKQ